MCGLRLVFAFLSLLILVSCMKLDTFPVTGVKGDYNKSQEVIAKYCENKTMWKSIKGLVRFQSKFELGNEIALPDVFFKRGYGDCDEFAVANCMIAEYFGYESFIGYLVLDSFVWHYNCIIKIYDKFVVTDGFSISKIYFSINDTIEYYRESWPNAHYVDIKPFKQFLHDIGIEISDN